MHHRCSEFSYVLVPRTCDTYKRIQVCKMLYVSNVYSQIDKQNYFLDEHYCTHTIFKTADYYKPWVSSYNKFCIIFSKFGLIEYKVHPFNIIIQLHLRLASLLLAFRYFIVHCIWLNLFGVDARKRCTNWIKIFFPSN